MRSTIVVCAFVVLACLCNQAKAESPFILDECPTEKELLPKDITGSGCMSITCHKDGSKTGFGCPLLPCSPGEQQVGEYDYSKPYPDCCLKHKCEPYRL